MLRGKYWLIIKAIQEKIPNITSVFVLKYNINTAKNPNNKNPKQFFSVSGTDDKMDFYKILILLEEMIKSTYMLRLSEYHHLLCKSLGQS